MRVNIYYILFLSLLTPNILFGAKVDEFIQIVRENKSTVTQAIKKYKAEEDEKKKDPFYRLSESSVSENTLMANLINQTLSSRDEDFLLRDERELNNYNVPGPNAPQIDALTKQVNKILQKLSTAPEVYELEAMYVLRKSFSEPESECVRQNLGANLYTRNYNYDPAAMFLLTSQNENISNIQVIKNDGEKEHVYYYRGVLDRKDLIVQVIVKDDIDDATINIFSLNAIVKTPKAAKEPELNDKTLKEPTKKYNKWGKLYGGSYEEGDFSLKGGFGLEYEYDKNNLPKNVRLWSVESGYQTENFTIGLASTLDTKKQEVRAKISKNGSPQNSLEFYLKGKEPGVELKSHLELADYSLKGTSKYYKQVVSGSYKFDEPSQLLNFNAGFSVDQKTKSESYEVSKDLYRDIDARQSTIINVKVKKDINSAYNQNSVWLGLSRKF